MQPSLSTVKRVHFSENIVYLCGVMKIIHTSDWHIGHSFFDFERYEEHARALAQLSDIVAAEQPDALLVSGDIFH